jgi:hypothetical protein
MTKLNKVYWGIIAGIIAPFLFLGLLYFYTDTTMNFADYLVQLYRLRLLGNFLKLALLFNLALFILFMSQDKLSFCKGVLTSTFLWGLLIVYMYFF